MINTAEAIGRIEQIKAGDTTTDEVLGWIASDMKRNQDFLDSLHDNASGFAAGVKDAVHGGRPIGKPEMESESFQRGYAEGVKLIEEYTDDVVYGANIRARNAIGRVIFEYSDEARGLV